MITSKADKKLFFKVYGVELSYPNIKCANTKDSTLPYILTF